MIENNNPEIAESALATPFVFAEHTTYKCGGAAKLAFMPETVNGAVAVYDYLASEKIPFVVLGNGSNVLASDSGFDGAVICTKRLAGVYRTAADKIFCRAGTMVGALLKYCADNCFGGLEYLAGIPATCGGLAYMNGGAAGKYVSDDVVMVKLYDGKIRNFSNKTCNFGYKYSTMQDINGLILGVEFKICPKPREEIKRNIAEVIASRSRLPKGASCGCVFKNTPDYSAGKVIDGAGLKGLSVGKAEVSRDHANFIINAGSSSGDVRALIEEVKQKVARRTGIKLEEEVVYIGDF